MSKMIDRVAKAIAEASLDDDELPVSEDLLEVAYRPLARAAIEAMRDPTDEMINSSRFAVQGRSSVQEADRAIYQAMINEALK